MPLMTNDKANLVTLHKKTMLCLRTQHNLQGGYFVLKTQSFYKVKLSTFKK